MPLFSSNPLHRYLSRREKDCLVQLAILRPRFQLLRCYMLDELQHRSSIRDSLNIRSGLAHLLKNIAAYSNPLTRTLHLRISIDLPNSLQIFGINHRNLRTGYASEMWR